VALPDDTSAAKAWVAALLRPSPVDAARAALQFVTISVAYLLMLAAMSFNTGVHGGRVFLVKNGLAANVSVS
jgi:hypothetical protein